MRTLSFLDFETDLAHLLDHLGLAAHILAPGDDGRQRVRLKGDAFRTAHQLQPPPRPGRDPGLVGHLHAFLERNPGLLVHRIGDLCRRLGRHPCLACGRCRTGKAGQDKTEDG